MSPYAIVCADEVLSHVMQRRGAAAQEFAHFMGQVVKLPDLPVGVALAGGLAVFEVSIADNARICEDDLSAPADPKGLQVYAWFVVGEIVGKRQLIGTHSHVFARTHPLMMFFGHLAAVCAHAQNIPRARGVAREKEPLILNHKRYAERECETKLKGGGKMPWCAGYPVKAASAHH